MQDFIPVQLQRFFNLDRDAAEQRYAWFRQTAYADVVDKLQVGRKYRLDGIGFQALKTFEAVWKSAPRRVTWDWVEEVKKFKRTDHSRLELAIWHQNHLCGLMLGSTSKRKTIVYIRGIEGAPYKHPLKGSIIPIGVEVAETYAALLDAKEIRIISPATQLVADYEKLGYNYKRSFFHTYMSKKIGG